MIRKGATKVKICGITRVDDAALALDLGAWALGFIFYPASPRYISAASAAEIVKTVRKQYKFKAVGVFVNETVENINQHAREVKLDIVQLHGDESAEFCLDLAEILPTDTQIIKAARPVSLFELGELKQFGLCDGLLLDTFVKDAVGGTGVANDFALMAEAGRLGIHEKIILSGGLTPENLAEALSVLEPFAVDVSSGVEWSPGIKNKLKLQEFFKVINDNI